MKAIQMFETLRGDAPKYLRSSYIFASDIHAILLRSSSNFQLYTPKPHLEMYRNTYFQVHPFGIPFLHICIVKVQYLRWVTS